MSEDVTRAMYNKIALILTGGDSVAPPPKDSFIAWCAPGIPFQKEDLQFAVKGISGTDASETRLLIQNASDYSRVANLIPDTSSVLDSNKQKVFFEQNGKLVWDVYKNVLNHSEIADVQPTDDQKTKLDKFRNLLVTSKEITTYDMKGDPVTKSVTESSPIVKQYCNYQALYESAVLQYNLKRLAALNEESRQAVQDFAINGNLYRRAVTNAYDQWVSDGQKNEVEQWRAIIDQITRRSISLLKKDLIDKLERAIITDPTSGSDFYMTSFFPGNFVNSENGWSTFEFTESSTKTYTKEIHTSVSVGTSLLWGLWKLDGDGEGGSDNVLRNIDTSDFSIKFSLAQVPISRPWFSPEFLTNKAWRFRNGSGMECLCDNSEPPKGQMTAYPTSIIFAKDVQISFKDSKDFSNMVSSQGSGGLSFGWGPFRIGGSVKRSTKTVDTSCVATSNGISVKGMQTIAFKCALLPQSPQPDSSITNWI